MINVTNVINAMTVHCARLPFHANERKKRKKAVQKTHLTHFPRTARLLKADEFCFQRDQRLSSIFHLHLRARTEHFLLYGRYTDQPARLGLVIGRKNAPRAATRNTLKRICRELFRLRRAELYGWDTLIRLHRRFDRQQLLSASSVALKVVCRDEIQMLLANTVKPTQARLA